MQKQQEWEEEFTIYSYFMKFYAYVYGIFLKNVIEIYD